MAERLKFRAVLFDWNGTLNDMKVVREQNKHVGMAEFGVELTDDDIDEAWGSPVQVLMPALFGRGGDMRSWEEMYQTFLSYDYMFPRRLRPGALEVLNTLDQARIVTGVVTMGLRDKVLGYMQQTGLSHDRFHFVHTQAEIGADVAAGRPALGRALGELALLDISPSQVLFIGDETVTMHDARAVGVDYAVVLGGTFSKERILQGGVPPHKLIGSLGQLPGILGIDFPEVGSAI